MKKRLETIFSRLEKCDIFADVGCDHGYISKMMLSSGKCNFAHLTDISEQSLKKAQTLLSGYVNKDSRVCDGLGDIEYCEQVLIAGMGGAQIINILENASFKPEKLLLQPMKDSEKVRFYLARGGYKIVEDFTFLDGGKYYDLIKAKRGKDNYSERELLYGRDNLNNPNLDFIRKTERDVYNFEKYLNKSVSDKDALKKKLLDLKEVLDDVRNRFTENSRR